MDSDILLKLSEHTAQLDSLIAYCELLSCYFRVCLIMLGALVGFFVTYMVVRFCRIRELI